MLNEISSVEEWRAVMKTVSHKLFRVFALCALASLEPSCGNARTWTETVLYRFNGGNDGADPESQLISDATGTLYGTTRAGGSPKCGGGGCGTVFKLSSEGVETILHPFGSYVGGYGPVSKLLLDNRGNLFGTRPAGGGRCSCAIIFRITQAGVYSIIYTFDNGSYGDSSGPSGGLRPYGSGVLVGLGASSGAGTIYKLTKAGSESLIYSFSGGHDGGGPYGDLISSRNGHLYGVTLWGGSTDGCHHGCGTVFTWIPGTTVLHTVHAFGNTGDEVTPLSPIAVDAAGNIYGDAYTYPQGYCSQECGRVFKLAPDGTETIISYLKHIGSAASASLVGGLVMDHKGDLFGVTSAGGPSGCGLIFQVPYGRGSRTVYSFSCGSDGATPKAGLLLGPNDTLYGTTSAGGNGYGVVFRLDHN